MSGENAPHSLFVANPSEPFMIILGTTEIAFTKSTGTFYCRRCRAQTNYRRRSLRQFVTVYFIPLVPISEVGQYIECQQCKDHFPVESLEATTTESERENHLEQDAVYEHVKRMMVLMMIADGTVDDEEIMTIRSTYRALAGTELSIEEVVQEAKQAERAGIDCITYSRRIVDSLTPTAKAEIVKATFLVATAAGGLEAPQQHQLKLLPQALGLTEEAFRMIIKQAMAEN